jgi:hypothetical protein
MGWINRMENIPCHEQFGGDCEDVLKGMCTAAVGKSGGCDRGGGRCYCKLYDTRVR